MRVLRVRSLSSAYRLAAGWVLGVDRSIGDGQEEKEVDYGKYESSVS